MFVNTLEQIKNIETYNLLDHLRLSTTNLKEVNTKSLKAGNKIVNITFKNATTMVLSILLLNTFPVRVFLKFLSTLIPSFITRQR